MKRLVLAFSLLLVASLRAEAPKKVALARVPGGGMKPDIAVDARGTLHMVYFKGKTDAGDAFYVKSTDGGANFSQPLQINSQPGSVQGIGNNRRPRLALGKDGRVHVLWNGSSIAQPRGPLFQAMAADSPYNSMPLLYARLNDAGTAFEAQRNLMKRSAALDGGSAIAADPAGNVYGDRKSTRLNSSH